MRDVVIIGNGPAGISAALYTVRAGFETTVIGRDNGALKRAEKIENYYGFKEGISGEELIENGIEQARGLGVSVINDEVISLSYDNGFSVKTKNETIESKIVILATGAERSKPKIQRFDNFEGKGVSYCASCDAFFYRGKDAAVLGCCDYALNEVMELLPVVNSVTLVTNGETPVDNLPANVSVITKKIESLEGGEHLTNIVFSDGEKLDIAGLFVAIGVAGSGDLARKLGAITQGTRIAVDEKMATNVPGLFAAGDCTGGILQISKAVYEGSRAGLEAIKFLRTTK